MLVIFCWWYFAGDISSVHRPGRSVLCFCSMFCKFPYLRVQYSSTQNIIILVRVQYCCDKGCYTRVQWSIFTTKYQYFLLTKYQYEYSTVVIEVVILEYHDQYLLQSINIFLNFSTGNSWSYIWRDLISE